MIGVDVSVWNNDRYAGRQIPWNLLKSAGIEFVIVRSSAGRNYCEDDFIQNVNGAHNAGLLVGAYHYSYAYTPTQAKEEAILCKNFISNAGVLLELPVFFDMEDGDYSKQNNGFNFSKQNITELCRAWLEEIKPLNSGIYASLSWFEDYIDWRALVNEFNCPIWNAQYSHNDFLQGYMWQFTDSLQIGGNQFDGNVLYDSKHRAGLNPWNNVIQS